MAFRRRSAEAGVIKGHETEKQELLSFTGMHFSTEESYMENNGYPRLSIQRREHAALMERLNAFVRAGERRMRPRSETIVDYLKDWLIKHTLIEDLQVQGFFCAQGHPLSSPFPRSLIARGCRIPRQQAA